MTLALILVSFITALILGLVTRNHYRTQLLLGFCTLAVYAFQPVLPVRGLDFWLPTGTLAISTFSWIITTPRENRSWRNNWKGAAILIAIVLVLGFTRYLGFSLYLTASRPPQILQILSGIAIFILVIFLLIHITTPSKVLLTGGILFIILLFAVIKIPSLGVLCSMWMRSITKQSINLASAQDLRWLGFSYIAFRLIHTIRDRQSGRLPVVPLSEYVIYIIFFPSLTAGPIDRIEHFIGDLHQTLAVTADDLGEAGKRLLLGLFKKFVIADVLAIIALNTTNAMQVRFTGSAWVLLYAYAFQIYFDFSGYTDIAIGLGRLLGFKLPENFKSPYFKPNITLFWNSWHMTLTQWFRAYFFTPVTRALRTLKKPLPIPIVIFITQVATMILIGLWHGGTWNFIVWGLWHGLGLFIHNRWSELTRACFAKLSKPWQTLLNVGGMLLTFNYVALGWVFFALPSLTISNYFIHVLFGQG